MLGWRRRPDDRARAFHGAWDAWWDDAGREGVMRILRDGWSGPTESGYRTEADGIGDLALHGAGAPCVIEEHLRSLAEDAGAAHLEGPAQQAALEIAAWTEAHAPRLKEG